MAISTTVSESGNKVTIAVAGKFDFQLYDEFRASYAVLENLLNPLDGTELVLE